MNKIRVRFAPSPTGPLHLGSVRTALYNYLFAKQNNGSFILRIEDTDKNRIIKGSKKYIIDTLKWCGIEPNEGYKYGGDFGPYCQSDRINIYKKYIIKLLKFGHAYYAFDKPEDINNLKLKFIKEGKTFSYNFITREYLDNSLKLSDKEILKRLNNESNYVIRIKIPKNIDIEINDIVKGKIIINTNNLDDKILIKSDGNPTYHIASVLDDYLMKISHIIRGEEWLPSFPIHILIYKFFNWKLPIFAHLPLILNSNSRGKISKRNIKNTDYPIFPLQWIDPNTKIKYLGFYNIGYLSESFLNILALLGWNPGSKKEIFSLKELIKEFNLNKINNSNSHFNKEKAIWVNKQHIKNMSLNSILLIIKTELNINLIKYYNDFYLKKIFDNIIEKCESIYDIWKYSKYFFIRPEYDKKIINKICIKNSILYIDKIIKIIYKEKKFESKSLKLLIDNFFIIENCHFFKKNIMQYIRLSLVGELYGAKVFFIMEIIGKKETIFRLNNFKKIFIISN